MSKYDLYEGEGVQWKVNTSTKSSHGYNEQTATHMHVYRMLNGWFYSATTSGLANSLKEAQDKAEVFGRPITSNEGVVRREVERMRDRAVQTILEMRHVQDPQAVAKAVSELPVSPDDAVWEPYKDGGYQSRMKDNSGEYRVAMYVSQSYDEFTKENYYALHVVDLKGVPVAQSVIISYRPSLEEAKQAAELYGRKILSGY
jgi:hypothetical protein